MLRTFTAQNCLPPLRCSDIVSAARFGGTSYFQASRIQGRRKTIRALRSRKMFPKAGSGISEYD